MRKPTPKETAKVEIDPSLTALAVERGVHPIVGEAASYARCKNASTNIELDDEAVEKLRASLEATPAGSELAQAVMGLVSFAAYLDRDLGSRDAAQKLIGVVASVAGALNQFLSQQTIHTNVQDAAEAKASKLQKFSGQQRRTTRAPRFGQEAPKGTVRAKSLRIPTKFV